MPRVGLPGDRCRDSIVDTNNAVSRDAEINMAKIEIEGCRSGTSGNVSNTEKSIVDDHGTREVPCTRRTYQSKCSSISGDLHKVKGSGSINGITMNSNATTACNTA